MRLGKIIHSAPSHRQNVGSGFYKRLIPNLLLLLVSCILCIFFVEISVRLYYDDKFAPRPSVYISDDLLGWRPRPNLDFAFHGKDYRIWIKTDDSGYRLGRLDRVPDTSNLIVAIGDSHTFGWGVDTHQTYPSYLDERVAEEGDFRVVNLGVGGYSTLQSALRLQRFADHTVQDKIRAIVLLHANNDVWDNARFLRVATGMIRMRDHSDQINSALHGVNFLYQTISLIADGILNEDAGAEMPFQRVDERRGFDAERINTTSSFKLTDGSIIRPSDIKADDLNRNRTEDSQDLTPLQLKTFKDSINRIHCVIKNRRLPIIHVLYQAAWEFYEEAVRKLVLEADRCGNRVYINRIPKSKQCKECGVNSHSGGHSNPAGNSYRADQIYKYLKRAGVFISEVHIE